MMKKEYRPHFSTITPCSERYLVTIAAGMPLSSKLPFRFKPGVMTVALIGSSMLKPAANLPNPCHLSPTFSIQSSREPMPSSAMFSGPQTLNHQSWPNSSSTLRIARRKSIASAMLSSTRALPPGGSIIAAATSHEAMMAYCGEVEVCIKYASLNTWLLSLRFCGSRTRICEACDRPASSLCVDWVAKIIESLARGRYLPIACMSL